jgi:hypothetical protein
VRLVRAQDCPILSSSICTPPCSAERAASIEQFRPSEPFWRQPSAPGASCVAEVLANGAVVIAAAITMPSQLIKIDLIEDDASDTMRLRP